MNCKTDHETNNKPQLVSLKRATRMVSVSRSSIYRWIHAGTFPTPVRIGERGIAFKLSELEKWIESRPRIQLHGTNRENR
ncbi:helix-turn-helix transcriptional regulator [Nitrosomonas supralitoralis]|nr:AlpA family phage regulatory protein [Nitrosomonas supralitoralis]